MKTSNKILLTAAIGVIALLTLASIVTRAYLIRSILAPGPIIPQTVTVYQLKDNTLIQPTFTQINIKGDWTVRIIRGDQYSVKIIAPGEKNSVQTQYTDNTLHLISSTEDNHIAQITLPKLIALRTAGKTHVIFSNFHVDTLTINAAGSTHLQGNDNVINQLNLSLAGDSHADLQHSSVINADVNAMGTTTIQLNMKGGDLMGKTAGLFSVTYTGTIRNQMIHSFGTSSIKPKQSRHLFFVAHKTRTQVN